MSKSSSVTTITAGKKHPFTIHLRHGRGTLRAEVSGTVRSLEVAAAYWTRIGAELQRTGCKKLLVVETMWANLDIFKAIGSVRRQDPADFAGVRIAFVDTVPRHYAINVYGAAAAARMGYEVEVFREVLDAELWLDSESNRR